MQLLEHLKAFNRKERFHLVGWALGNPQFVLAESFRQELQTAVHVPVPGHAFVAMDYHLDWIYASLFLAENVSGNHAAGFR